MTPHIAGPLAHPLVHATHCAFLTGVVTIFLSILDSGDIPPTDVRHARCGDPTQPSHPPHAPTRPTTLAAAQRIIPHNHTQQHHDGKIDYIFCHPITKSTIKNSKTPSHYCKRRASYLLPHKHGSEPVLKHKARIPTIIETKLKDWLELEHGSNTCTPSPGPIMTPSLTRDSDKHGIKHRQHSTCTPIIRENEYAEMRSSEHGSISGTYPPGTTMAPTPILTSNHHPAPITHLTATPPPVSPHLIARTPTCSIPRLTHGHPRDIHH